MGLSKIEWTDRSDWNPFRGCTRVSNGCGGPGEHGGCYAEAMAARFSKPGMWGHGFAEMRDGKPRWTNDVALIEERLSLPLTWRTPAKIFVNSTSDPFHKGFTDDEIARFIAYIAASYWHTHQLLTKRPERARELFNDTDFPHRVEEYLLEIDNEAEQLGLYDCLDRRTDDWRANCPDVAGDDWPLKNLWLGTSAEDQLTADERIPQLLATPAAVRFISCEPLLGPIDLSAIPNLCGLESSVLAPECWGDCACDSCFGRDEGCRRNGGDGQLRRRIDQVIVGGESGRNARPMHPDWARSLRDQCVAAGVPFFFKQWGEWAAPAETLGAVLGAKSPSRLILQSVDGGSEIGTAAMQRIGKASAGRLLDGREWNEFPTCPPELQRRREVAA